MVFGKFNTQKISILQWTISSSRGGHRYSTVEKLKMNVNKPRDFNNKETNPFSKNCLQGKVAIITGGHSGIGFGIAQRLCEHGAKVVLMGRRQKVLDDAAKQLNNENNNQLVAIGFQGDVRSEESAKNCVKLCIDTFGKLDTLINSAAGNFLSLAEDLTVSAYKNILNIDTVGVFNMAKACFEELKKSKQKLRALETRAGREIFWLKSRRL